MKLKIQLALLALLAILNDAASQTTIVLKENFNYVGGSMHVGDEITIGSSQIKIQRVNGKISELTISERDPYTGEIILNYYGFTVVMKYLPSQKKIYWAWSSTDFGWFYFETLKERNAREAREEIERKKQETKESIEQQKREKEISRILNDKVKLSLSIEENIASKIQTLIDKKDFLEAAKIYLLSKGNTPNHLENIKESLLKGLNEIYQLDTQTLSSQDINLFTEIHSKDLNQFASNNYIFKFNNMGICSTYNKLFSHNNIPTKKIGPDIPPGLKVGDNYMGGKVVEILKNKILISYPEMFYGSYLDALDKCSQLSKNNVLWRLPNKDELASVITFFDNRSKYRTICQAMYWTGNLDKTKSLVINHIKSEDCRPREELIDCDLEDYSFAKIGYYPVTEINLLEIPLTTKCEIRIYDEDTTVLKTEFAAFSKKTIYQKSETEFLYISKNDLTIKILISDAVNSIPPWILRLNVPKVTYIYDVSIPENKIRVISEIQRTRKANNIQILNQTNKKTEIYKIYENEKDLNKNHTTKTNTISVDYKNTLSVETDQSVPNNKKNTKTNEIPQIIPYQRTAPVKINNIGVYPKLSNGKNWDGREPGTYSLRFKIRGLKPGDTAYIADYYLDNKYLRDTAVVDKKGLINFTGDKKLQRGMYLFVMPKKADFFEFIVDDDQDFTISTDTQYWKREYYKTMKVEGSDQNAAFAAYQNGRVDLGIEIAKLDESIKKETNETAKKAMETSQKILYEKKENYDKDFIAAHPDHLLSRFLYAMMDVDVPEELPTKPDGTKDSSFPYNYYKAHYWDHVDLGEDGLVRMPVNFIKQKLNFYFDKLVSPDPDSCIKECNMILDKVKNTIDMEHFVIYHLTYKYETSKIMGQDAVFVNLALNNYCNGKAWWTDSTTVDKMCEAAVRKSSTLVGRIAPPLELLTPDSTWVNTASIKAPYTLVIFWDPTCGHCKEVMPKLAKVYEKNKHKGWKVIALASSDKKSEWIQYLAEHPEVKEFVHLRRGIVRSEEMAHNMQSYYIVASPTIFVLDKDKKILANRIDSEKIEDFIGHFETEEAGKAAPKK